MDNELIMLIEGRGFKGKYITVVDENIKSCRPEVIEKMVRKFGRSLDRDTKCQLFWNDMWLDGRKHFVKFSFERHEMLKQHEILSV